MEVWRGSVRRIFTRATDYDIFRCLCHTLSTRTTTKNGNFAFCPFLPIFLFKSIFLFTKFTAIRHCIVCIVTTHDSCVPSFTTTAGLISWQIIHLCTRRLSTKKSAIRRRVAAAAVLNEKLIMRQAKTKRVRKVVRTNGVRRVRRGATFQCGVAAVCLLIAVWLSVNKSFLTRRMMMLLVAGYVTCGGSTSTSARYI